MDNISIRLEIDNNIDSISFWQAEFITHIFNYCTDGEFDEELDGESGVSACNQIELPAIEYANLWDNLIYDYDIKQRLLNYAETSLLFSQKGIDNKIISINRVILLHGPPGTGKTSLCKALAQKLSIRMDSKYSEFHLIEINSHSLFSKWFSESGKLVQKLFDYIREMIEIENSLIFVLIDEVESLSRSRNSCISGNEPSDALRAVNAVLTQIDKLKNNKNVMILTTSNISESIDLAFIDRADIKEYIGLPNVESRYEIIRSCLNELIKKNIIKSSFEIPKYKKSSTLSIDLQDIFKKIIINCDGLSGRNLRKLPLQTYAYFIHNNSEIELLQYLKYLNKTIEVYIFIINRLNKNQEIN